MKVCMHKRKSGNLNILRRKSLNQQKRTQHEYIHGSECELVCVGLNRGELISTFVLASLKSLHREFSRNGQGHLADILHFVRAAKIDTPHTLQQK